MKQRAPIKDASKTAAQIIGILLGFIVVTVGALWLYLILVMNLVEYYQTKPEIVSEGEPEILHLDNWSYTKTDPDRGKELNDQYIIKNHPRDLDELKDLVEKYNSENPVDISDTDADVVYRRFLRVSNYSSLRWALYKDGLDDLEYHWPVDLIASVTYRFDTDTQKFEMTYQAYSKRNNKGEIIKEITWEKPKQPE